MKNKDALMTVMEAAEFLGLVPGTVYHFVSERRIPCVHLSARCVRFRRSDLEAWVAAKVTAPEQTDFSPSALREGRILSKE
jgi:excisionase family DNA binding protein